MKQIYIHCQNLLKHWKIKLWFTYFHKYFFKLVKYVHTVIKTVIVLFHIKCLLVDPILNGTHIQRLRIFQWHGHPISARSYFFGLFPCHKLIPMTKRIPNVPVHLEKCQSKPNPNNKRSYKTMCYENMFLYIICRFGIILFYFFRKSPKKFSCYQFM